ncbi:hypothetical protein [Rhizobium sp. MHM7A]|uniref:hypothetical protein n=1 Tax=Rhizobium sp. MHM7A TaxID=2583233 RepID=UPI001106F5C0|nr:hypothetical protein [Rhizobium sp. MHM7A]TLX16379.1 hypothetical protein FFR93_03335 [Rhizobium sp. MHM7A]
MTEQMTNSAIRAEILDRLENAVRRDIEKDGTDVISAGLRSTTDIAGYLYPQVPVSKVSRILDAMCLDREIDWYGKIEGLGNVSFWRLALNEGNDGDGEPVIVELQAIRDNNLAQVGVANEKSAVDVDLDYWFPVAA